MVSLAIWDHTMLLATRHKQTHSALTPADEGWYSIYRPQWDGRLSWPPRWLVTYRDGLPVTHLSIYRAHRRVTMLIETNVLQLSQTTTNLMNSLSSILWEYCPWEIFIL